MRRSFLPAAFATVMVMLMGTSNLASANSFEIVYNASERNTVQHVGVAPIKKEIVLALGPLRLTEGRLPDGVMTVQQRNLMRARIAIAREDDVTNARRKRLASLNKSRDKTKPDDDDDEVEAEDQFEDEESVADGGMR